MTTPKEEGGLGLRNITYWNKSCIIKLLWMLFFRTESVWVASIHQNVIQDKDFWSMKESQSHTWLFKQILRQREIVLNWLRIIPVEGNSINFWTLPWTPYGQLIRHVGPNGPRQSGIPLLSSLASLRNGESWTLAPARSS